MRHIGLLAGFSFLLLMTRATDAADTLVCPQYKAMEYGDGTALFYSLRCPDTMSAVGYVQASGGNTFSGCQLNCPPLQFTFTRGKSKHLDATDALRDNGVRASSGPFVRQNSTSEYTNEEFHSAFPIKLLKENEEPFKHKGKDVVAEAIGVKITPKNKPAVYFLVARQVDTVVNPAPATVTFHEDGKFLVHFDCELPKLPGLRATGQLILLKN